MSIELTPEQINEFLSKAILESKIGEAVKASVARVLAEINKSYDNPIDNVIRSHVAKIIDTEIMTTHRPALEASVKTALDNYLVAEILEKIVTSATEKLRSRY